MLLAESKPFWICNTALHNNFITTQDFESSRESRAQADLKFTYVVSCQIYGQQKQRKAPEAADIALLLQRYQFVCLLFSMLFKLILYNIIIYMGTHTVYLKMCFWKALGH